MDEFTPKMVSYRVTYGAADGKMVFKVAIDDISPVKRNPGIGIFNDNKEESARDRVIKILRGFKTNDSIPPVEVVPEKEESDFRYKLVHGAHRLYCSLAAGFTHVPAIKGFDINAIDE